MLLLSSILGGITGVVGSVATAYSNYKIKKLDLEEKKIDNQFSLDKMDKQKDYLVEETKAKVELATKESEGKEKIINSQAFLESVKATQKDNIGLSEKLIEKLFNVEGRPLSFISSACGVFLTIIFVIINIIQSSIRPGITIVYSIMMFYIAYKYYHFINLADLKNSLNLNGSFMAIIDTITYIASSACLFWFGDRSSQKFIDKMKHKEK